MKAKPRLRGWVMRKWLQRKDRKKDKKEEEEEWPTLGSVQKSKMVLPKLSRRLSFANLGKSAREGLLNSVFVSSMASLLPQGDGALLDVTDLGMKGSVVVERWMKGLISGRRLAVWIADQMNVIFPTAVLEEKDAASKGNVSVFGGPLEAMVGGLADPTGEWVLQAVISNGRSNALKLAADKFAEDACDLFLAPFAREKFDREKRLSVEQVNIQYRRQMLDSYPSRPGGEARQCMTIMILMEVLKVTKAHSEQRCFEEEFEDIMHKNHTPSTTPEQASTPMDTPKESDDVPPTPSRPVATAPMLTDDLVSSELTMTKEALTRDCVHMKACDLKQLEKYNGMVDDYLLRMMRFKSNAMKQIAKLKEDSAYTLLGLDASATLDDIKKAYKKMARFMHPDKGGDKTSFQELSEAYERLLEQKEGDMACRKRRMRTEDSENEDDETELNKFSKAAAAAAKEAKMKAARERKEQKQKEKKEKEAKKDKNEENSDTQNESTSSSESEESVFSDKSQHEAEGSSDEEGKEEEDPKESHKRKELDEMSSQELLEKARSCCEEADKLANASADFAGQCEQAVGTVSGIMALSISQPTLLYSVAHTCIQMALGVVKAVRTVGYACIDVSHISLHVSKSLAKSATCASSAASSMAGGFDVLAAGNVCAKAVEKAASDLRDLSEEDDDFGCGEEANRISGEVAKAASDTARSALQAAAAARSCFRAIEETISEYESGGGDKARKRRMKQEAKASERAKKKAEKDMRKAERKKRKENKKVENEDDSKSDSGKKKDDLDDSGDDRDSSRGPSPTHKEETNTLKFNKALDQRLHNQQLLQRLNTEILAFQLEVKELLMSNVDLVPDVSVKTKESTFTLVSESFREAFSKASILLERSHLKLEEGSEVPSLNTVFDSIVPVGAWLSSGAVLEWSPVLLDLKQPLALPLSMEVRVAKLAALLDSQLLKDIFTREFLCPLSEAVHRRFPSLKTYPLSLIQASLARDKRVKTFIDGLISVSEIQPETPTMSPPDTPKKA